MNTCREVASASRLHGTDFSLRKRTFNSAATVNTPVHTIHQRYFGKQEAFEKCWAPSLLRAVLHCHSPGVATAATVARSLRIDVHYDDDDDDDNDDNA